MAAAQVGQVVTNADWTKQDRRSELLVPALTKYQQALDICDAPGVVQSALRDLELIQAAGIEGLKPIFELLQAHISDQKRDN